MYRTLIEFVWQNGVRFHDLRCLITFVWAIVGLLLSQQIHVSQWMLYRPGPPKAASKQRQLARWLHNVKISPSQSYEPLIRAVLGAWAGQGLYLALDKPFMEPVCPGPTSLDLPGTSVTPELDCLDQSERHGGFY